MDHSKITVCIIKALRVFLGICLIIGLVASVYFKLDIELIGVFILFCVFFFSVMTVVLRKIERT